MAGQGVLIKYAASIKGLLATGRTAAAFQQTAGLKNAAQTKLADMHIPEKPKRPMTPYFRFMKDFRADVLRKEPTLKLVDISKRSGIEWSQLHVAIKEKYTLEYQKELEEYGKKAFEYNSKLSPAQKDAIKMASKEKSENKKKREVKKRERDANKPKRPIGPYMQYMLEQAKQNSSLPYTEVVLKMKGTWAKLSDLEKVRYKELFEIDKKRYEKEMLEWEAKMLKEGNVDLVRNTSPVNRRPSRFAKEKENKPTKQ